MDSPTSSNARRWDGRPGHYEVWYVTVSDPATRRAFRIRTTLLAPKEGAASGALWCVRFSPGEPPRAFKTPIAPPEGPQWKTDMWDLRITSSGGTKPFKPIPATLRGFMGTKIVSPHLDARVSGTVRVGHEETVLRDAPGTQSHLWGRGYGAGWAWAHANFEGGVFEALAGRKPALASFFARHGRREWKMNTLLATARNRSIVKPSPTRWKFSGTTHNRELVGAVSVDPRHVAGVAYTGPSGETVTGYHSELATIRLELRARSMFGMPWSTVAVVEGPAHYEFATRERVPGFEIIL